jgi:hypothetical protein
MRKILAGILSAALVMIFTGCTKDNGYGRLVVNITDAPFPIEFVEEANVTITKVEIREACDGVSDGTPFSVLWEGSKEFNLLDLRNGVVAELLDLQIPVGEYDLVRLYVDEAGLTLKEDAGSFTVKVPSGPQTGIKIFIEPGLVVEGGLTSELMLDFDLSNSFLMQGNMDSPAGIKGFHFKPVIRAVNNSTAGILQGIVYKKISETETEVLGGVTITIKQGDEEISTAISDETGTDNGIEDGYYAVPALPSGNYSVIASKDGFDPVTVDDVEIVAGNKTTLDFTLEETSTQ